MDLYATHLVPSMTAAVRSGQLWPGSPILEMGCGHYSTPWLSTLAKAQGRELHVITSDPQWGSLFEKDNLHLHLIQYAEWKELSWDKEWGMVFVDGEEPEGERYQHLLRLSKKSKVVVMHDAEVIEQQGISWGLVHSLYRYVYFYERYVPTTVLLSNYADPREWF
jgi:hypothetical protein